MSVDALLSSLSPAEMAEMLSLLEELESRKRLELARNDFLAFIALVDPAYKFGTHLRRLGGLLVDIEVGRKDRIAVSMGPRFGKSQMISIYYPAWYLGKHPDHKLIIASHTADLAVDMLRKVRNLMQTSEYKRIFPDVAIAADAKAAGKWNTNKGGEAFATGVGGALAGRGAHLCCAQATQVMTLERGCVPAGSVVVGEHLQSWHGWAAVEAKIEPEHTATVTVAGRLQVSTDHPIWTFTRGWLPAAWLRPEDILWSTTLFDTIKAHLHRSLHDFYPTWPIPHAHIQHLGAHATAVHQPKGSKLSWVRRVWGHGVRAVVQLCELLRGHGAPAITGAHAGSGGQHLWVFAGELPLGGCIHAAEQSDERAEYHSVRGDYVCSAVGPQDGGFQGRDKAPGVHNGYGTRGCTAGPEDEPRDAEYSPVTAGWLRRAGIWLLSRRGAGADHSGLRQDEKSVVVSTKAWRWAGDLCGLLLGVRRVGPLTVEAHDPRAFVNFMVDGDHTFVGDTILSHNCIVDDPHSEQDIKAGNTDSFDSTYEWYRSGLRTRLMPGGAICLLHTRWAQRDLIGRVTKDASLNPDADQYEVFEFPAILNADNEPDSDRPPKSLWPEQWSLESLLRTKASMPAWQWNAQYMQNPTAQESALIKREWIRWWQKPNPPKVDFIVQGWDTALTTKERSDFSVCQTWGVFRNEDTDTTDAILLNQVRGKWEFPDLKVVAHEQEKEWQPDSLIIEAKASGQPLIDELRRSGITVTDFSPGKGQDKLARVNSISDMIQSGQVWFPETQWATEVVEELVSFPAGEHDDMCFVANTRILMADGRERDILDVTEGDFVWTPTGAQRVCTAGLTSHASAVIEVEFSAGQVLRGTANHPVYVPSVQAFVPLGNLQQGDVVCTPRPLNTAGLRTVDTLIARAHPYAGTSTESETGRMKPFIAGCGKMLTGLSRWGTLCTTKMGSLATTVWATLSVLQQPSMGLSTGTLNILWRHTSGGGPRTTEHQPARPQPSTPAQPAVGCSHRSKPTEPSFAPTNAMMTTTGPRREDGSALHPLLASSAERDSRPTAERLPAPMHAVLSASADEKQSATRSDTHRARPERTHAFATSAGQGLKGAALRMSTVPINAGNPEPFDCSVSAVRVLSSPEPVYSLTVEGNPVFYANGVLVHNCDTLTLCLARIRKGGLMQLHSDQHDSSEYYPPRRAGYY